MTKKTDFNEMDMQRLAASREEWMKQLGWLGEPIHEARESLIKASPHNGVFTYDDVSVFVMGLLISITGSYSEMAKVINMMAAETTLHEPIVNAATEYQRKKMS